ncbi:MAG: hypothetical protein GY699_18790, partial [Desulfobacteraceae bacterium]|nr:hypothetical protein [Desulfobacteraceae bacterium]
MSNSNIIKFLPPMTFNKNFISKFIGEKRSCAALGIVETSGQQKGFLAFKPDKGFNTSTGQNGFELGSGLLGTSKIAILHLVLNFDNEYIYDILLNLNSPVVRNVLKVWEKTDDHFFFAFGDSGFTAFDQTLGEAWRKDNYFGMLERATNTVSQYEDTVNALKNTDMLFGTHIDLIFQDEVEFLDLS